MATIDCVPKRASPKFPEQGSAERRHHRQHYLNGSADEDDEKDEKNSNSLYSHQIWRLSGDKSYVTVGAPHWEGLIGESISPTRVDVSSERAANPIFKTFDTVWSFRVHLGRCAQTIADQIGLSRKKTVW